MKRKPVMLAILLAVLALALVYAYVATPRLEKAPVVGNRARVADVARTAAKATVTTAPGRINFDFLSYEPQEFPGAKRDIFHFARSRPVMTKPSVVAAPVAKAAVEKAPEPEPLPVPVPVRVVQKSLGNFTFVGFLEKAGSKTVFLTRAKDIFLVKKGDSFDRFTIEAIGDHSFTVRHPDWDGTLEVPLIEKQRLNASVSAPARRPPTPDVSTPAVPSVAPAGRRMTRSTMPRAREEFIPDVNEENNPVEEQEPELPVEGDVLEGEVNDTNQ